MNGKPDGTFRYWWTHQESSGDKRTGARATVVELIESGRWKWRVYHDGGLSEGTSTTQKSARAACRRVARKLDPK